MKITLRVLLIFLLTTSLSAHADIVWNSGYADVGDIVQGMGNIRVKYRFFNTGKDTAYILNVQSSCGCYSPHWTREPVGPGQFGTVTGEFDASQQIGAFNKTMTVSYVLRGKPGVKNETPHTSVLTIAGNAHTDEWMLERTGLKPSDFPKEIFPVIPNIRIADRDTLDVSDAPKTLRYTIRNTGSSKISIKRISFFDTANFAMGANPISKTAVQSDSITVDLFVKARRASTDAFLSAWVQLDNGLVFMPDKYYYVTDKRGVKPNGKVLVIKDTLEVLLDTSKAFYWGQSTLATYVNYSNQELFISGYERSSASLAMSSVGLTKTISPGHPGVLNISVDTKTANKGDWLLVKWSNGDTVKIWLKYKLAPPSALSKDK